MASANKARRLKLERVFRLDAAAEHLRLTIERGTGDHPPDPMTAEQFAGAVQKAAEDYYAAEARVAAGARTLRHAFQVFEYSSTGAQTDSLSFESWDAFGAWFCSLLQDGEIVPGSRWGTQNEYGSEVFVARTEAGNNYQTVIDALHGTAFVIFGLHPVGESKPTRGCGILLDVTRAFSVEESRALWLDLDARLGDVGVHLDATWSEARAHYAYPNRWTGPQCFAGKPLDVDAVVSRSSDGS